MVRKLPSKRPLPPLRRTFVREWREYRGLTQEQLLGKLEEAGEQEFAGSTLSRLENARQPYNQIQIEALARVLDCSPVDILTRDPNQPPPPYLLLNSLQPDDLSRALNFIEGLKLTENSKKNISVKKNS